MYPQTPEHMLSGSSNGLAPGVVRGIRDVFEDAPRPDGRSTQERRRSRVDAGLSLPELAAVLVELGAESAINLDGGGSTTLVHRRHLLNRPYSSQDQPAPESRPIVSALVFESSA